MNGHFLKEQYTTIYQKRKGFQKKFTESSEPSKKKKGKIFSELFGKIFDRKAR